MDLKPAIIRAVRRGWPAAAAAKHYRLEVTTVRAWLTEARVDEVAPRRRGTRIGILRPGAGVRITLR